MSYPQILLTTLVAGVLVFACGEFKSDDDKDDKDDGQTEATGDGEGDQAGDDQTGDDQGGSDENADDQGADDAGGDADGDSGEFEPAYLTEFQGLAADHAVIGATATVVDQATWDAARDQTCASKVGDFQYVKNTKSIALCLPLVELAGVGDTWTKAYFVTQAEARWKAISIGDVDAPNFVGSYITKDAETTAWEVAYFFGYMEATEQRLTIHYHSLPVRNKSIGGSPSQTDMWATSVNATSYDSGPLLMDVGTTNDTLGIVSSPSFGTLHATFADGVLPALVAKSSHGDRGLTALDLR